MALARKLDHLPPSPGPGGVAVHRLHHPRSANNPTAPIYHTTVVRLKPVGRLDGMARLSEGD